jgi:hypothetical protein
MNYVNLVQRIRACESEVAAQLLLEGWINRFQYNVGLDIGEQHDQANVVVVCKHFPDASTSHVVFAQDLTASKGQFKVMDEPAWVGLTDEERKSIWTADQMTSEEWDELFNTIEAKLKEKNT